MAKKKKEQKSRVYRKVVLFFSVPMFISIALVIYKIYKMNILNSKYFLILSCVLLIITLVISILALCSKKAITKIFTFLLLIGLTILPVYLLYNINLTERLINSASKTIVKKEIFNVYVLNDSSISSISELKDKRLGIFNNNSEVLLKAVGDLKKKVNASMKKETYYDDIEKLLNAGIKKEEDAIFITSTLDNILSEQYQELIDKYKVIGTIEIKDIEKIKKNTGDITKEPFIIYVSGIDTYGNIGNVSRSDVNILIAINPKTNNILLVNTPRDYYVKLHSKGAYDKLTHAGIYGVDESLHTLEDLYDVKIDYYFKVNFSSLIKVVDAIGGIEVDSKYSFSYDGYTFRKGKNKLNGKSSLAFSRFRKGLPEGDISRGENQEAVIKAIVEKLSSPSILANYASILSSLSKSFVTNISTDDIYKLVKNQMNNNDSWIINSSNARGYDASDVTYSTGKTKLYVMKQDESSVLSVKTSLKSILE